MRHLLLAPLAALALAAGVAPASAQAMGAYEMTEAAASLRPGRYIWADTAVEGPVSVLISLPDQRAYVFRGETMVAATTISTGKDGKETPVGTYPILQKKEFHRSNLYDDAPMPFMQRLTWDGVALHAGANPGFPASHGCVRLPTGFAKRLFAITTLGTTVQVTDDAYIGPPIPEPSLAELERDIARETAAANRVSARRISARR